MTTEEKQALYDEGISRFGRLLRQLAAKGVKSVKIATQYRDQAPQALPVPGAPPGQVALMPLDQLVSVEGTFKEVDGIPDLWEVFTQPAGANRHNYVYIEGASICYVVLRSELAPALARS